jgi:thiol-disulfide isomerase/thioredoxin
MDTFEDNPKPASSTSGSRWLKRTPAILILAFLSFRFFQLHNFKAPKHIDVAPLKLINLDGTPMDPGKLTGKAIVLNFWAPWCPPCRLETPWLQHLQDAHPADLVVVGVVADSEQYKQAQAFMSSRDITYPLARESPSIDNVIGAIAGLPTTLYISPSGRVVHTATGLIPETLMKHYANDAVRD